MISTPGFYHRWCASVMGGDAPAAVDRWGGKEICQCDLQCGEMQVWKEILSHSAMSILSEKHFIGEYF